MTVYAVYNGDANTLKAHAHYLTAGKEYEAIGADEYGFHLIDDEGEKDYCIWTGCSHLPNDGDWTRIGG